MATRVCGGCGEERDCESDFYRGHRKDGKCSQCKSCHRRRALERYSRVGPSGPRLRTCASCNTEYRNTGGNGSRGSRSLCPSCFSAGRICSRCKAYKPLDRFYRSESTTGRYCLDGCIQANNRELLYGLERGTGHLVFAQFGMRCAICGATKSPGRKRSLVLDHCHKSFKIRGVLCDPCNKGLGDFRDSVDLLRAAIAYLERSPEASTG